ncbi:hypothetical protein [Candidatus Palauibacter sp.]|uniref:hypothetical protein n=1 Tax=Candidatus Palauibacter sp. TaxID=3101350 RepID=UPI003B025BC7
MTVGVDEIMSGAESSIRLKRQAKIEAWRDGAAPERTEHTLYLGDARDMPEVREPVHLVVTSPPYFNLIDYDGGRQHLDGRVLREVDRRTLFPALPQPGDLGGGSRLGLGNLAEARIVRLHAKHR